MNAATRFLQRIARLALQHPGRLAGLVLILLSLLRWPATVAIAAADGLPVSPGLAIGATQVVAEIVFWCGVALAGSPLLARLRLFRAFQRA